MGLLLSTSEEEWEPLELPAARERRRAGCREGPEQAGAPGERVHWTPARGEWEKTRVRELQLTVPTALTQTRICRILQGSPSRVPTDG